MRDDDGPLPHIHATCPYGLDYEHNGLWLKIMLEAV